MTGYVLRRWLSLQELQSSYAKQGAMLLRVIKSRVRLLIYEAGASQIVLLESAVYVTQSQLETSGASFLLMPPSLQPPKGCKK